MKTRDLIELAGKYPLALLAVFIAIPLAAWVVSLLHKREAGGESPWKFIYSTLVYLACIAGVPAAAARRASALCVRRSAGARFVPNRDAQLRVAGEAYRTRVVGETGAAFLACLAAVLLVAAAATRH